MKAWRARPSTARSNAIEPAGHAPPWHRQPEDDEAFYVLEGDIDFWIGTPNASPRRAGPGEFTPAGHERFYRAAGNAAAGGGLPPHSEPDMARVQAAAREHGVELLGPPPGMGEAA